MMRSSVSELQVDVEEYLGIPWAWLDEINAACDRFFISRGMPVYSVREQIHAEGKLRVAKKLHKERYNAV